MTQGRKSLDNKIVYVVSEFTAVLLICQAESDRGSFLGR